jgi:hypothetical protein
MTSRNKIAVISWVIGGLAMTCVGAAQAHGGTTDECTTDAQGNVVCVKKTENEWTSPDGKLHVHQTQDCTTVSKNRLDQPAVAVGQQGVTHIGASVDCSTTAP